MMIGHGVKGASSEATHWLTALLARNAATHYLQQYSSPDTLASFREQVSVCKYETLSPWLKRIEAGEKNVLFHGRPVAYERTGGSTGGSKLIPYSEEGLADFRRAVSPWLAQTLQSHAITGTVYFSISPAGRVREEIQGVPLGLPDTAYLDEAMQEVLMTRHAVPFSVAECTDIATWRAETLHHLRQARTLEMISVWSPTFLLSLLEGEKNPAALWPALKVISCWADGASRPYAEALAALFPGVTIAPKGLISTEAVVTVPNAQCEPELTPYGFFEFLHGDHVFLAHELLTGTEYSLIVTTASGLYRYRTDDVVRCRAYAASGQPILDFSGRGGLYSDLVGEKLEEAFVASALEHVRKNTQLTGFSLLVPDVQKRAYVLVRDEVTLPEQLAQLEEALCRNPQYAYARALGQLKPVSGLKVPQALRKFEEHLIARGMRPGDIKPSALRPEPFWLEFFERGCP